MLSIGIVGLPNAGKSTLFQALTRIKVPIANYPFTTIAPHAGITPVPDERLEKLSQLLKPEKTVPAAIEFTDIAGLIEGAHRGEGLGNQFLSHIYAVDAILFLVRIFHAPEVSSPVKVPAEALAVLREELAKKDEDARAKNPETPLLAGKPSLVVCNFREGQKDNPPPWCELAIDCKLELEMSEMTHEELAAFGLKSKLNELISLAYKTLNLISFYTVKGGKELRAWPLAEGLAAPEAGGVVHTDFKEKFIRAEVANWQKLIEAGSWAGARELGWIRTEGREYTVKDGDVIEFKI